MAIDTERDYLTYNGSVWSAPSSVSTPAGMVRLSCASKTLCAATDGDGDVFTYDGHSWSAPDNVDGGTFMSGVSCAPATTFCVAVAGDTGGDAYIYSGGSWSSQVDIDNSASPGMVAVSCAPASYCMAIDPQGNVVTTSDGGSTWTAPDPVDETGAVPTAVSCHSSAFCTVVDSQGNAFSTVGAGWTESDDVDQDATPLVSVSCASGTTCLAVSDDGGVTGYSSGNWGTPAYVDPENVPSSISCAPVSSLCVIVDDAGDDVVSTDGGTHWTLPTLIDDAGTGITSVSCVSSIFCAAVDVKGNVLTYNGSTWSVPVSIDGNQLDAVSCATASLCVAVDNAGNESTYNGTSWSGPSFIDSDGFALTSVSCTATPTTFCAAVDSNGNVFTSVDGSTWSPLAVIDPDAFLTSVSCATASFCVAVDAFGYALDYDGSSWSAPQIVDHGEDLDGVSCTTTPSDFCAAVDQAGNGVSYNGTWSAPFGLDSNPTTSVSCASSTFCQAADQAGHVEAFDQSTLGNVDPGNILTAISCPTVSFCATVDDVGNALVYDGTSNGVSVSEVSPDTGPTTGGTSITITGTGFTVGSDVDLAGVEATGIDVVSSTEIMAFSPPESAGTVDVIVTAAGGPSTPNPADQFTYTVVQSPTTTGCDPSCSETVSTTLDQTQVTVAGASDNESSEVSLVVNTDTLNCGGTYDYPTAVSTVSSTDFAVGATVSVTDTVANEPSKKGVKVCYSASSEATSGSFLGRCPAHHAAAPCVESLVENTGKILATLLVPATDPRFWTGSGNLDLTGFSPTHGPPGKKVTIKGSGLTQVSAVVIGGAQAQILSRSSTKVTVKVPQGAVTGTITVTADSGDAVSALPFTVT
jgi:photosystem II stability/assembly factor-like uncharacterized protein